LKYIFVAGAPGSKWSSVARNIYHSPDIDRSDYTLDRIYHGVNSANPTHMGAYWDPGNEFGSWFDQLDQHGKQACETEFDRPFSGTGIRIIKSHMFMYHVGFLKRHWPDSPVVLVHRGDDACLGWWVRCGGFNITYPDYRHHYKDVENMYQEIVRQNSSMRPYWDLASFVNNSHELCERLKIQPPAAEYSQIYADHKVRVKVI
jgi:hypothetical protein